MSTMNLRVGVSSKQLSAYRLLLIQFTKMLTCTLANASFSPPKVTDRRNSLSPSSAILIGSSQLLSSPIALFHLYSISMPSPIFTLPPSSACSFLALVHSPFTLHLHVLVYLSSHYLSPLIFSLKCLVASSSYSPSSASLHPIFITSRYTHRK